MAHRIDARLRRGARALRSWPCAWLAVIAAGCSCQTAGKLASSGRPPDAATLARTWLLSDCFTEPELEELEAALRSRGEELLPLFREALLEGPPAEVVSAAAKARQERLAAATEQLEGGETFGLDEEQLQILRRQLARDAAVASEELDGSYRRQAAAALVVIGLEPGLDELRRLAGDPNSPLRGLARDALGER